MMVTGATVTATRAPAAPSTNMQIVDNISLHLQVFSQGPLNSHGTVLPALQKTLLSTDLLKELANVVPGYTYKPGDKLVYSTIYSNFLVTNADLGLTNLNTNVAVPAPGAGSNISFTIAGVPVATNTIETTNIVITNSLMYLGSATNAPVAFITTNTVVINTNGVPASTNASFDTNATFLTTVSALPTNGTITNLNILSVSGTTNLLFTNVPSYSNMLAIMQGGTAKAPNLISVTNWIDPGANGKIYQETGKNLTKTNFDGTNITAQTVYKFQGFSINCFVTNGTSTSNLILDVSGFTKAIAKVINLTVGGTAKTAKEIFLVNGNTTSDVSGSGHQGGTFLPYYIGNVATNGPNHATNVSIFDDSFFVQGNFVNGGGVTNGTYGNVYGFLTNATPIIAEGTITVSFLKAYPQ